MKSQCQVCGTTFRGIPLNTVKDGKKVETCPNCYKTLEELYRKNSCIACVFFNIGSCELFGTELEEPYLQNLKCEYVTTDPNPNNIAKAKIKKFELSGRFEEAAKEYEKIGQPEKAEQIKKRIKTQRPTQEIDLNVLLKQLSQRGQTLTYYCCHCGEPLKIGGENEVKTNCPKCSFDLSVIDLVKLINQHL
jgi:hypothetical protein